MGKLTLHARIEIGLVGRCYSAVALWMTNRGTRSGAADVAYDVVLEHDTVTDLESGVADIEARLNM